MRVCTVTIGRQKMPFLCHYFNTEILSQAPPMVHGMCLRSLKFGSNSSCADNAPFWSWRGFLSEEHFLLTIFG